MELRRAYLRLLWNITGLIWKTIQPEVLKVMKSNFVSSLWILLRSLFVIDKIFFLLQNLKLAEVFAKDGMSFLASCQNLLSRPWVIDDLDAFKSKWTKKSWEKVNFIVLLYSCWNCTKCQTEPAVHPMARDCFSLHMWQCTVLYVILVYICSSMVLYFGRKKVLISLVFWFHVYLQ